MIRFYTNARAQSGFAYIAAIVLLVVVAGMATALLRLTGTQQSTVNQALLGAKAGLAARAGIEWGFRTCLTTAGITDLSQFRNETGFNVSVDCQFTDYREGERASGQTSVSQVKRIVQINAVACNGSAARCPDANANIVAGAEYVERARMATVCIVLNAGVPDGPCET
ncbi:MSHA biogenesis protein MshP [Oxalobacteraceae sp. CFBP 13730]|nr:MSHA biogenesis protein MshP [Oxalobacteraceae sp. CFBP 13730]